MGTHMCRSKDNLWELVLSSYRRDQSQGSVSGSRQAWRQASLHAEPSCRYPPIFEVSSSSREEERQGRPRRGLLMGWR